MAQNNDKFVKDTLKFILTANSKITRIKRLAIYELFSNVVDRTPTWFDGEKITGITKWNWTISINQLSGNVLKGVDPSGERAKAKAKAKLFEITNKDEDVYIENSVPWIFRIEEGTYPNPSGGSYIPGGGGAKEIRTSGGFSKQSPAGMAKVSSLEWNSLVNKATLEVHR